MKRKRLVYQPAREQFLLFFLHLLSVFMIIYMFCKFHDSRRPLKSAETPLCVATKKTNPSLSLQMKGVQAFGVTAGIKQRGNRWSVVTRGVFEV